SMRQLKNPCQPFENLRFNSISSALYLCTGSGKPSGLPSGLRMVLPASGSTPGMPGTRPVWAKQTAVVPVAGWKKELGWGPTPITPLGVLAEPAGVFVIRPPPLNVGVKINGTRLTPASVFLLMLAIKNT